MKVSLKESFTLLDGRLSTDISKVYKMLNYIFDASLLTHQLPVAMKKLKKVKPEWFKDGVQFIEKIKVDNGTNDFGELMEIIDSNFSTYEIKLEKIEKKVN